MRISVRAQVVALALMGAVAAAPVAQANGPVVGRGAGGIVPLGTDEVQLVSERVFVDFRSMKARCTYELRNLSHHDTTFEMAFVVEGVSSYEQYGRGFEVSVDRKDVPVRFCKVDAPHWAEFVGATPDSLPVWPVEIPAQGTVSVRIKYGAAWGGGGDGRHVYRECTYSAKSAALWAGVIEEASVSFLFASLEAALLKCCPECVGLKAEPADWEWSGLTVHWTRTNWEPEEDFRVALDWLEGDEH